MTNYFKQRIEDELGLSPDQYTLELKTEIDDETTRRSMRPVFTEDEQGNIQIVVYDLKRNVITYDIPDSELGQTIRQSEHARHTRDYIVTRLNPEYLETHKSMPKYLFPKGKQGTYPFIPPLLLEKYERGEQLQTLVLTEGYFKAMKASVCGIDIIGLGSVTLFAESNTHRLYPDIVRVINRCKPRNIIILYDGDCTDLSKDKLADVQKGSPADLSMRPLSFFNSLTRLRELLIEFESELHFAYVRRMRDRNAPKGLDDLLCDEEYRSQTEEIADDLNNPGRPGIYFEKLNLRTMQKKLRQVFNLVSPQQFYEAHAAEIGTQRFRFKGAVWHYNDKDRELENDVPEELKDYIHVGDYFYLRRKISSARNDEGCYRLLPRKSGTICLLHGKDAPQKIARTAHYDDFINKPSHTDYQPVINGQFNLYNELSYSPEYGTWDNIHHMLNHIFGADDTQYYQMALDYLQLLYTRPMQVLPVLCLVSKESGTGKTTFLNLLKYMFEGNCAIGGNDVLLSGFNSLMAGRLVIGIDETSLGDNQEITEKIKMLATSKTINMEAKGKDKIEMDNFCKFVLCSNNERKFIYTSKEEIRFWVIKVNPLNEDEQVRDLDDKMQNEVPAFVNYLLSREMYVKEPEHNSRMWFSPTRLENNTLRALKDAARPLAERTIREFVHDMFMDIQNAETLYFDLSYLRENIPDFEREKEGVIRNILEINLQLDKKRESGRYKMPFRSREMDTQGEIKWSPFGKVCRPYIFHAADFVDKDELAFIRSHIKKTAKTDQQPDPNAISQSADLPADPNTLFPAQDPDPFE